MVTHPETSIDPLFLTPPYAKSLANKKKLFLHILLVLKFSSTSLDV